MIQISEVCTDSQIAAVAQLAGEIWREYYEPITGLAQVEYMLDKFQSPKAIAEQIAVGQEYHLAVNDEVNVGYLAIIPNASDATLKLSKIYVRKSAREQGVGRMMLEFVENLCRQRGIKLVWLTVNKHNRASIDWYSRRGFTNAGSLVQDIGGGFVMDDYRMEKVIA